MSGIFKPALNPHAYKQFKRICPRLNASYGEEPGTGYAAVATIVGPLDAQPDSKLKINIEEIVKSRINILIS
jgi:hypothetical protein